MAISPNFKQADDICWCGAYRNQFGETVHLSYCQTGKQQLRAARSEREKAARRRRREQLAGGAK